MIGAGVLVVASVAGLLVWQPWNPSPVAPASVSGTSPTGTRIRLTWPAPAGGAAVGYYVILRDGKQVAHVPAGTLTWTDTSVQPGDRYVYGVATAGGGTQSGSSPTATVTALTPPPSVLAVSATYTTTTLNWRAPTDAPTPTSYVIYNSDGVLATIPGSSTSYTESGEQPGTPYQYAVVAEWGSHKSQQTTPITGSTRAVPLSGPGSATVTLTASPAGSFDNPTAGKAYKYNWTFDPTCRQDTCTVVAYATMPTNAAGKPYYFAVTLGGSDASGYFGSAQGHDTYCETSSDPDDDTLSVRITPVGPVRNGTWTNWQGTLTDDAAANTTADGSTCEAAVWSFTIQSSG